MHGGLITGPQTPEGLERSRRARWIHGRYSREAREARGKARMMQPPSEYEIQAAKRRFAREDRRESRKRLAEYRAAMRRLKLGPA